MNSAHPSISELLAGHAHVLHTKWRLNLQKRIVELNGQKYVLYRFRFRKSMDRFADALQRLKQAGIRVQSVCARSSSIGERLRHGNWLALSYLPGRPLEKRPEPQSLAALGQVMATLNTIEGPAQHALFHGRHPQLPHSAYIAAETGLSEAQRAWIDNSLERLRQVSGTQLTHGDLFGDNILVSADHSIGLIDYELLAYDISGIELAATLLRPFCRKRYRRRALLDAYLAACPAKLKQSWDEYGRDFVFAAAARLAMARRDRIRHIARQERLLNVRRLLPLGMDDMAFEREHEGNLRIVRSARRNEAYYLNVARLMIDLCIEQPDIDPVTLLRKCDHHYRRAD